MFVDERRETDECAGEPPHVDIEETGHQSADGSADRGSDEGPSILEVEAVHRRFGDAAHRGYRRRPGYLLDARVLGLHPDGKCSSPLGDHRDGDDGIDPRAFGTIRQLRCDDGNDGPMQAEYHKRLVQTADDESRNNVVVIDNRIDPVGDEARKNHDKRAENHKHEGRDDKDLHQRSEHRMDDGGNPALQPRLKL